MAVMEIRVRAWSNESVQAVRRRSCALGISRQEGVGIANGADCFPDMGSAIDTATTVRELEAAGMDRSQAEVVAAACRKASEAEEPVTRPELDAALAQLESRLVRWVLAIGAAIVAAVKVMPGF